MKKAILILILLIVSASVKAQHGSDMIKSQVWDIIATLKIKTNSPEKQTAVFSPQLKALENKRVSLQGYMIPLEESLKHKRFLLSTLPINQCYYCGKNGVPIMIEVEMDTPIEFTYKPVIIAGTFKLIYGNVAEDVPIALERATRVN